MMLGGGCVGGFFLVCHDLYASSGVYLPKDTGGYGVYFAQVVVSFGINTSFVLDIRFLFGII
ncbi:MAG: hypothetical protein VXY77_01935 [Pseudomonadota bacterium]|nr:hypothetical protein [Pseudomonadota bacterium]